MSDGLEGVVAADTVLSEVDGLAGRLIIRGHSLDQLAGRTTFEEVTRLLWDGFFDDLPDDLAPALGAARVEVFAEVAALDTGLLDRTPIEAMRALTARLADGDDLSVALRLTAAPSVFTAAAVRAQAGEAPVRPDPALGHAADTLRMLRGKPGSAAEAAGILTGDRVTKIGDVQITDFQQLPEIISTGGGETLRMDLLRSGKPLQLWVTPRMTKSADGLGGTEERFVIGVLPSPKAELVHHTYNPVTAFGAACGLTVDIVRGTLVGIGQIVTGKASVQQLHGPVGIADITRKVAEFGFLPLLRLVAFLSVSIGLVNLFPIPLLDGGHLLYYGCEAVLGRPLGERAQDVGFRLGLVLVLGLMLLTTWNDLVRLNLF